MLKFLSEHPSPHTLQEASSYSPLFLLPNLIFFKLSYLCFKKPISQYQIKVPYGVDV